MKCEEFESVITDYFDHNLNEEQCLEFEKHSTSCEKCSEDFREYKILLNSIADTKMELPDESMKLNFYYMLQSEINRMNTDETSSIKRSVIKRWPSALLKIAAGFVLIIAGAFLGNIIHQKITTGNSSSKYSVNTKELNEKRDMLLVSLLNEDSPGERIKAVSLVEENKTIDPKLLNALIKVLNNDQNVNVRLAAAYTLSKFLDTPMVRDSVVESLGKQSEPLIQIMLMNILTEKKELKAVEPMKKIIQDNKTIEQVKYAAEKNINVLI
jgi:hypothetical protein